MPSTRKQGPGRPRKGEPARVRVGRNLNVWLPEHLVEAFEKLCESNKRTKTAEAEIMVEEHLAKAGMLPKRKEH